ncbi:GNAT family N-acetyltransferase [Flexithrix dorotheae]|uniref:GNAT family N-acetyltransferase n=1 Tax=Flexithrix dorotheae TaxID=70993 RepID=UPI00035C6A4A|nr:GNAT family N-acetyltransferase [Flexithrix dorotheae]
MQDMLVRLYDLPQVHNEVLALEKKGITIRRPLAPEKTLLTKWAKNHFSALWADEVDVAFSRNPVSCLIAIQNQEIIGFACYETTSKNYFGPTGVLPTHRGLGLGKILLIESLRLMKESGYAYAIIGGVGPAEFYKKAVDAVLIEGSDPGIYKGLLKEKK